jgi:hypothetical protein
MRGQRRIVAATAMSAIQAIYHRVIPWGLWHTPESITPIRMDNVCRRTLMIVSGDGAKPKQHTRNGSKSSISESSVILKEIFPPYRRPTFRTLRGALEKRIDLRRPALRKARGDMEPVTSATNFTLGLITCRDDPLLSLDRYNG